jgi:molybdate transport system regulatory protein
MVRYRLKVDVDAGPGRAQLLELIDELGSLKKAVARLGMSYRNAWGYLRELEEAAGFKILERGVRGSPASGTRLTRRGREFLAGYRLFREDVEKGAGRKFKQVFGGK